MNRSDFALHLTFCYLCKKKKKNFFLAFPSTIIGNPLLMIMSLQLNESKKSPAVYAVYIILSAFM